MPLAFETPEASGEVVVPVRLVRSDEEDATLVVELENPAEDLPELVQVLLYRARPEVEATDDDWWRTTDDPPDIRSVEVREGRLRVEGLRPGRYRAHLAPGANVHRPQGLLHNGDVVFDLTSGLVTTRSLRFETGAGLRVTVRGVDGELVGGEYEFFDHEGRRASLVLGVPGAFLSSWSFGTDGTHEASPLVPGSYRLLLRSPGYAERSETFELRAGAYTDVDVTLSR